MKIPTRKLKEKPWILNPFGAFQVSRPRLVHPLPVRCLRSLPKMIPNREIILNFPSTLFHFLTSFLCFFLSSLFQHRTLAIFQFSFFFLLGHFYLFCINNSIVGCYYEGGENSLNLFFAKRSRLVLYSMTELRELSLFA